MLLDADEALVGIVDLVVAWDDDADKRCIASLKLHFSVACIQIADIEIPTDPVLAILREVHRKHLRRVAEGPLHIAQHLPLTGADREMVVQAVPKAGAHAGLQALAGHIVVAFGDEGLDVTLMHLNHVREVCDMHLGEAVDLALLLDRDVPLLHLALQLLCIVEGLRILLLEGAEALYGDPIVQEGMHALAVLSMDLLLEGSLTLSEGVELRLREAEVPEEGQHILIGQELPVLHVPVVEDTVLQETDVDGFLEDPLTVDEGRPVSGHDDVIKLAVEVRRLHTSILRAEHEVDALCELPDRCDTVLYHIPQDLAQTLSLDERIADEAQELIASEGTTGLDGTEYRELRIRCGDRLCLLAE